MNSVGVRPPYPIVNSFTEPSSLCLRSTSAWYKDELSRANTQRRTAVLRSNDFRVVSSCLVVFCVIAAAGIAAAQQGPYSGLGASSVSAETIARYAPPPLDPAVSRRIQAILDVRAPGMGAV